MSKEWRNPRQVVIRKTEGNFIDSQRLERLVALLSDGLERALAAENENSPAEPVDFCSDSSVTSVIRVETGRRAIP